MSQTIIKVTRMATSRCNRVVRAFNVVFPTAPLVQQGGGGGTPPGGGNPPPVIPSYEVIGNVFPPLIFLD